MTDSEKEELCTIAYWGCDRTTARNFVGITAAELRAETDRDAAFARRLIRAEATAEMRHMKNVHGAAGAEKNWRTSVWWLERRAPERYGRRDVSAVTPTQLKEIIDELAETIVEDMPEADQRQRLVERLRQAVAATCAKLETPPGAHADDEQEVKEPGDAEG